MGIIVRTKVIEMQITCAGRPTNRSATHPPFTGVMLDMLTPEPRSPLKGSGKTWEGGVRCQYMVMMKWEVKWRDLANGERHYPRYGQSINRQVVTGGRLIQAPSLRGNN